MEELRYGQRHQRGRLHKPSIDAIFSKQFRAVEHLSTVPSESSHSIRQPSDTTGGLSCIAVGKDWLQGEPPSRGRGRPR